MKNQESALETGLLLLGIIIAIGMAILMGARTMTSVQDQLRRSKKSPARGDIGAERHQHISTVAAR
jgi:hypothetical protein